MSNNEFQDWKEVKWDKRGIRQSHETKKDFLLRENLNNRIVQKKTVNTSNINTPMAINAKKLEAEEENFNHKKVSLSVAKKIAQKRTELKLTQRDLAMKLSLPESIIKDYEKINGSVIPNPSILNKIEKILGRVRD